MRRGVLSQIASAYADHEISIKEVVQKSRFEDAAELMIITQDTPRENIIEVEKSPAGSALHAPGRQYCEGHE